MLSISQVGTKCGLSRSTLLYYDALNLVRPSYRTAAGYRLYSAVDEARLRQVCRYRKGGLPLREIRRLLENPEQRDLVTDALQRRLAALDDEIAALRRQQQVVLQLLARKRRRAVPSARALTKARWIAILRAAGMREPEMRAWHVAFEAESPLAHQDFLESLGLPPAEIRRIRAWSRECARRPTPARPARFRAAAAPASTRPA